MAQQWLRYCKLTVAGGGDSVDLSQLRIRFQVTQHNLQSPNVGDITISNLSDQTVKRIKGEGTEVTLEAGYQENPGLIFKGQIIQKRSGRENPVDTYLNIIAQGGDQAYNYATVNKTLAAGHSYRDQVLTAYEAMKPFGITLGKIADLGDKKMPRARVMFGMARDILRTIAISTGTSWSIQNNELTVTKNNEPKEGGAIVLNSRTGLIGLPVQSIDGILVTCLLNPQIGPGSLIQIDQASVQEAKLSADYTAVVNNAMIPSTADDGFYKCLVVNHIGDTRGDPWYTQILCLRADGKGPIPLSIASQGIAL
ncbi:phage protein [Agrobacterium pusense]|uniref:phage protein n=1 Tax=Agrobacterium pusense TaxID=648995 RepID=UPI0032D9F809